MNRVLTTLVQLGILAVALPMLVLAAREVAEWLADQRQLAILSRLKRRD